MTTIIKPARRVAVIGLGLIGGSLLRALAAQVGPDFEVIGWDADHQSLLDATAAGLTVIYDLEDLQDFNPDLVFFAVPLVYMRQSVAQVSELVGENTLFSDVGSVKGEVLAVFIDLSLQDRFVGAHPMAGTEKSGFLNSSADLLWQATWALTVTPQTSLDAFVTVLQVLTARLQARISVFEAQEHDALVALVSHLPHVFALEILNLVSQNPDSQALLNLAAGSFRDGTRVGLTDPERTAAMVRQNADAVIELLDSVISDLTDFRSELLSGANSGDFFHAADQVRQRVKTRSSGSSKEQFSQELDLSNWFTSVLASSKQGFQIVALDDAATLNWVRP